VESLFWSLVGAGNEEQGVAEPGCDCSYPPSDGVGGGVQCPGPGCDPPGRTLSGQGVDNDIGNWEERCRARTDQWHAEQAETREPGEVSKDEERLAVRDDGEDTEGSEGSCDQPRGGCLSLDLSATR